MLKVFTFCLLSFVFGNSFLLAIPVVEQPMLITKTTKSTKEPIALTEKQTALIKEQILSTEDQDPTTLIKKTTKSTKKETTLTEEDIQKINQEVKVKRKQIITALETKSYVEGINEVYNVLCKSASVPGFEANDRLMLLLTNSVLKWIHNTIKNPLPKDNLSKAERVNQAIFIVITLYSLNSNKLESFFKRYIGPFLVTSDITDDQVIEIVIEKLNELKKQAKSQGIKYWFIRCIKDVLAALEKKKLYNRFFTKTL